MTPWSSPLQCFADFLLTLCMYEREVLLLNHQSYAMLMSNVKVGWCLYQGRLPYITPCWVLPFPGHCVSAGCFVQWAAPFFLNVKCKGQGGWKKRFTTVFPFRSWYATCTMRWNISTSLFDDFSVRRLFLQILALNQDEGSGFFFLCSPFKAILVTSLTKIKALVSFSSLPLFEAILVIS